MAAVMRIATTNFKFMVISVPRDDDA